MIDKNLKLVGSDKVENCPNLCISYTRRIPRCENGTIYGQVSPAELHSVMIDVSGISTNQRHHSQLWSKEGNGRCLDVTFGSDFFNQ